MTVEFKRTCTCVAEGEIKTRISPEQYKDDNQTMAVEIDIKCQLCGEKYVSAHEDIMLDEEVDIEKATIGEIVGERGY